ncbi:MAG TPA: 2-dehydropantoate 2-reductase [Thermoplasmata archaeon]|nr:2-dehydropantoate 2-reductase [Thermoplasmata archaeon]
MTGDPVRVLVFGAGAVGSRFAAALAEAGHSVTVVGRPAHVAAIVANGLVLEGESAAAVHLEARTEAERGNGAEVVLLTVKSYDVETAGRAIAAGFPEPVPVVALSNGLGIETALSRGLSEGGWPDPEHWTIRGVHTVPARLTAPGVVRSTGTGEVILGRNPAIPDWSERLRGAFETAGFVVRVTDEIDREVWRKALVNAAINPVTADHGLSNGRLVEEPWRGQATALLREALRAAAAEGQEFDPVEAERTVFGVVRATAANRSSMLEDLDHGRRTEIDAISGAIADAGRRHGIPMPATERAIVRIRTREAERRAAG